MSDYDEPKSGSKTIKILLLIFGVGGVVLLVCCGGVYWVGSMMMGKLGETFTMDQEVVRERTRAIADIEVPENFPPFMAMDMSSLGIPMKMVNYGPQDQSRSIVLMQMIDPSGQSTLTKEEFDQAMNQQSQGGAHQLTVRSSERWIFDFDGEEYTFELATGTDPARNVAANRLSGVFPAKEGPAFLSMMAGVSEWDESAVLTMMESIGGTLLRKEEGAAPLEAPSEQTQDAPAEAMEETPAFPGDPSGSLDGTELEEPAVP